MNIRIFPSPIKVAPVLDEYISIKSDLLYVAHDGKEYACDEREN